MEKKKDSKENELVTLIELVDKNYIENKNKFIWRSLVVQIPNIVACVLAFLVVILIVAAVGPHFGEMPPESQATTLFAEAALIVATVSLGFSLPKEPIVRKMDDEELVDWNYENIKEKAAEKHRPLLKGLIKMKCKNPEFDLKGIHSTNASIFNEKELLKKLYE
jgi:hypothetical protein